MHKENIETADDRMGNIRTAIESADDTGMVSEQEALHVVGDAESTGDEREADSQEAARE